MPDWKLKALPPQVWAHYHPFYGTPAGPAGKWLTWNEPLRLGGGYASNEKETPAELQPLMAHDPERFLSPGRRDNYSCFYPLLGLYDCLDPKTLSQHAKWAAQAKLDGLIWDYMLVGGNNEDKDKPLQETIYDRSLRAFLDVVRAEGIKISASIMYDSYDWFAYPVRRIADELGYLAKTYLDNPLMLHFDGRLVVFLYATFASHTPEDWTKVCEMLRKAGLRDKLFLVAGEVWVHRPDFHQPGLFDGFCAYNQGVNFLTPKDIIDLALTLKGFADRSGAPFWSATLEPGFDGRAWHHPGRVVARGRGELYESLWEAVIQTSPPLMTVCSFNEWGEGTQIEPTQEYGELFLDLTARCAERYRQSVRRK